ncbi:MAG: FAD-dependent oxidoreductase, partial [Actinomycetota bacterium]
MDSSANRVVVVGNGMVGQRFVDELLARPARDGSIRSVTVLGAELVPAYDRVALSSYFDGASVADLTIAEPGALAAAGVDLRLGATVVSIDRAERRLTLADGSVVGYEHLVLATGSDPFVPPVAGADRPGCFVYRTLDDLAAIEKSLAEAINVLIEATTWIFETGIQDPVEALGAAHAAVDLDGDRRHVAAAVGAPGLGDR